MVGLDPRTAEAYKDWGRAEDKERRVKTVEQLEQALLKAKPDAQKHFQQGAALHKEGELDKALAEYDKAVELYPRYPEVYYNRGLAYRQKDELARAVADYSRAIRLDPKYVPAYANRGYVYYKLGRLDKALADFDKILELDPGNANAKESRNIILSQKTSEAKMSISKQSWGKTPEGAEVDLYTLGNANGLRVKIMTYGATITSVEVPDRNGKSENITLHLDSLADYLKGHPFFGSTVGRYGNRIAKGKFSLDGKQYTLATNNGPNHLHGGLKGFDKAVWKAEPVETDDSVGVVFSYESADGEEGYPGALSVRVTYSLTNDNELKMAYWAKTDKPTVLNLTNHTYWNLDDGGASDVLGHELTLNADRYLPVDAGLIPLGELKSVKGTPMDFLQPKTIGARIDQVEGGYDHCYVLNKEQGEKGLSLAARVVGAEERPRDGGLYHAAGHPVLHRQLPRRHAARRRQDLWPAFRVLLGDAALSRFAEPADVPLHRAEARRGVRTVDGPQVQREVIAGRGRAIDRRESNATRLAAAGTAARGGYGPPCRRPLNAGLSSQNVLGRRGLDFAAAAHLSWGFLRFQPPAPPCLVLGEYSDGMPREST